MKIKNNEGVEYRPFDRYLRCGDTFMGGSYFEIDLIELKKQKNIKEETFKKYLEILKHFKIHKRTKNNLLRIGRVTNNRRHNETVMAFKLLRYFRHRELVKVIEKMHEFITKSDFNLSESFIYAHLYCTYISKGETLIKGMTNGWDLLYPYGIYKPITDKQFINLIKNKYYNNFCLRTFDNSVYNIKQKWFRTGRNYADETKFTSSIRILLKDNKIKEVRKVIKNINFKQTGKIL